MRTPFPTARTATRLVLFLSLCLAPDRSALGAQALPQLAPGTRVRLTSLAPEHRRLTGEVVVSSADTLAVTYWTGTRRDTVALARGVVTALDVSRGRRANAAKGFAIGALAGAVAGTVIYLGQERCTPDAFICLEFGPEQVIPPMAAIGAAIGLVVGLASHTDRWEQVRPARALLASALVRAAPEGHGIHVGFRRSLAPLRR
jgi:hypothetical protein